jgi:hypothetical protein
MLYLEAPLHIIEGVSVFRDHGDPLQWYYLPIRPRLVTLPADGGRTRIPQLQLIKFRGSLGGGGFLNFDVDLGIEPALLEEVGTEIKKRERLNRVPRLAPVPLVDGTVKLMLFDRDSSVPAAPAAADAPAGAGFVLAAMHNAKPALYGDNQAAFSVQLSERGVTILEKALQGEMSPIGIVYSLDFLALRPAYNIRISADWNRVQKHFEEHHRASIGLLYQSQIDDIVDELVEAQAIVIEVDTFVPEGDEAADILGRRDDALNDLRDMVTEKFFEPSLEPMPRMDGSAQDLHTASRVIKMIATGGTEPLFGYSQMKAERTDKKRIDVDMRERSTVKRSIFPQGHLSGLLRTLQQDGLTLDNFIVEVDTDDPWFQRRQLEVIGRVDFNLDKVVSVAVRLTYNGESKDAVLTPTNLASQLEWASLLANGRMVREVKYSYAVTFQGVDGHERPLRLTAPERSVDSDKLEILPRELYSIAQIPVDALNFPWERYSHVQVQLAYADAANGIRQEDELMLTKENAAQVWPMFLRDPAKAGFRYRVIYRAVDNNDVEGTWVETNDERVVVRDPYPTQLEVAVVPVLDWTRFQRAFVDLRYEDEPNDVFKEAGLEFSKDAHVTQLFRVPLRNPKQRRIAYQVTVIAADGSVLEVPSSDTRERRILIRGDMRGHRIIEVLSSGDPWAPQKVAEIKVHLRYVDSANGLNFADVLSLRAPNETAYFEYDFADAGPSGFEYQIERRFNNGLSRTSDWQHSNESRLMVGPK